MSYRCLTLAVLILTGLSLHRPAIAAEPAPKPSIAVADLAWIAGDWEGLVNGESIEERWFPPAGGAMVGMFRWMKGDQVVVYELLSIEPGAEGPILWLRHFGPKLVGREGKDGAIPFYLLRSSPTEVVFDNRDPAKPIRLGYTRNGDRGLAATLERMKDGKWVAEAFPYTRR